MLEQIASRDADPLHHLLPPDSLSACQRQKIVQRGIAALYRWYVARSQPKRDWNPDTDLEWRNFSRNHSEDVLQTVQGFFAVEQYVPDYTAELVRLVRQDYGRSQFQIRWGAEEAKHADLWRNVLLASGYRDLPWLESYTEELRERSWGPPFEDPLEMLIYTVFQERATYINYMRLRALAEGKSEHPQEDAVVDPVLAQAAKLIATDEVAHFEFYLSAAQIYLYYFPERTLQAIARVLAFFEMPAARIIPDYGPFIESLYRLGLFGRRIYVVDVVRVINQTFGISDFDQLDLRIKQARAAPDRNSGALLRTEALAIADHSIVQHSLIRLFTRLCQFEHEAGISELFGTGFQPFDWEASP